MQKLFITALAGLLVACTQNSVPETPPVNVSEIAEAPANAPVIQVMRYGNPEGRTLVLIPGLASSAAVWDGTVAEFNDFDLRVVQVGGFAGAGAFTPDGTYTDAISKAVLDHLGAVPGNETVLIGHSMGGFVSLKTALKNQDAVSELIIVDSLPFLAGLFMPGTTPEQAATSASAMRDQMLGLPRGRFDAQQAGGLPRLIKTADYVPTLTDWAKASDQATVSHVMGELLSVDLREEIAAITVPTLVLAPYDATMGFPQAMVETLYTDQYVAAENATVTIIPGSYHFIQIDQADAFYTAVRAAVTD